MIRLFLIFTAFLCAAAFAVTVDKGMANLAAMQFDPAYSCGAC